MALGVKAKYIFAWLAISSLLYFFAQALATHTYSFLVPLDHVIPFIPEFIWVYHTLLPVIVGTTIFTMHRREVFFNTIISLTFSMAVLAIFHLSFPSFYPRQGLEPQVTFSLSVWLVEMTRQLDAASNTFPSTHVTFSWVLYFCIKRADCATRWKGVGFLYLLWAVLVSLATLFLKQHYIFDVFAGVILAYISIVISRKITSRYQFD